MYILKTRYVRRFLHKYGVPGWSVQSALKTLLDGKGISLGSQLYKIRMRDEHKGKSGSYRTLWFWKRGELVILCFLFAKNQAENLTDKEEKGLKLLAKEWSGLTRDEIEALIAQGEFERIEDEHD